MKRIIKSVLRRLIPNRIKQFIINRVALICRMVCSEEWFNLTIIPLEQRINRLEVRLDHLKKTEDWLSHTLEPIEQQLQRIDITVSSIIKKRNGDNTDLLSQSEYVSLEKVAHRLFSEHSDEYKEKLLSYSVSAKNVLEIGSGEGDFLVFLKSVLDDSAKLSGIDINPIMAQAAEAKKVQCICKDAVEALNDIGSETIDVIYALHIIEHLENGYLREMLNECYRVLKHGGTLVIETPNTQSLYVLSHYYFKDSSHKLPRHPSLVMFSLGCVGFDDIELDFLDASDIQLLVAENESKQMNDLKKDFNKLMFSYGNNLLITAHKS